MRKRVVLCAVLCAGVGLATPCAAQDVPYVELAAGYNFMRYQELVPHEGSDTTVGVNRPKGLFGEAAVNLNHAIGVVGLLTHNRPTADAGGNLVGLMGGLRFSARGFARGPGRGIGFFHVMGGYLGVEAGGEKENQLALQLGGGANITVTDHAGIRVEADYIRTFHRDAMTQQVQVTQGFNFIRFSVGVMYGFGAH
jgi:hypothetical protein